MTLLTKGMGAIIKGLKGTGKKIKGRMDKDPNIRKKVV